jgi:hypothetical protein
MDNHRPETPIKLGTVASSPVGTTIRVVPKAAIGRFQPGMNIRFAGGTCERHGYAPISFVRADDGELGFELPINTLVPMIVMGDDIYEYETPCTKCRCKSCLRSGEAISESSMNSKGSEGDGETQEEVGPVVPRSDQEDRARYQSRLRSGQGAEGVGVASASRSSVSVRDTAEATPALPRDAALDFHLREQAVAFRHLAGEQASGRPASGSPGLSTTGPSDGSTNHEPARGPEEAGAFASNCPCTCDDPRVKIHPHCPFHAELKKYGAARLKVRPEDLRPNEVQPADDVPKAALELIANEPYPRPAVSVRMAREILRRRRERAPDEGHGYACADAYQEGVLQGLDSAAEICAAGARDECSPSGLARQIRERRSVVASMSEQRERATKAEDDLERLSVQAKRVVRAWEDDPTSLATENAIRELGLRERSSDSSRPAESAPPDSPRVSDLVVCDATMNGDPKVRCSMIDGEGHGPVHKRITKTGRVTHSWPIDRPAKVST